MEQHPLTVILDIKPQARQELETLLVGIGQDIRRNPYLRFPEIETVHFARFVMIGGGYLADRDAQTRLYFSSNHDGPAEAFIDLLLDKAGPGVQAIFRHCEGYPDLPLTDPQFRPRFQEYIRAHTLPTQTFYAAYRGHSVRQVQGYIRLRQELNHFLAQPPVDRLVETLAALPLPPPDDPAALDQRVGKALVGLQQDLVSKLLKLVGAILVKPLSKEPTEEASAEVDTRPEVTDWLYTVQNEITVISAIDPQKKESLERFLWVINAAAEYYFNKGSLSGLTSIHFARWVIIDNGQNLLFESNYDGNWEQYIGDFVDKASVGMDGIWSNCLGYPSRGAKELQSFKKIIIDHQVRAQVFYSAYPQESVRNILNDIEISKKLGRVLGEKGLARWLAKL